MAKFAKGHSKLGGRQKGVPNKATAEAREAIESVFTALQEDDKTKFLTWARGNLDTYYSSLFPKLLPVQLQHQGHDGGKLVITWEPQNDA